MTHSYPQDDGKPWGFITEAGEWINLPKPPLLMSGAGPPPFDVTLPSGEVRHVVHKPANTGNILSGVLIFLFFASPAIAAPPSGVDLNGPMHKWFNDQKSVSGQWCCSTADGHILEEEDWRTAGSGYEVRIGGAWFPVPPTAMRDPKGGPNPTGKPVVWYNANQRGVVIYCFAPGFFG